MTDPTNQNAAGRWYSKAWAATKAAATWALARAKAAGAWAGTRRAALGRAALVLAVLAALIWGGHAGWTWWRAPAASAAAAAAPANHQSIETRLTALEGMVSALHADQQQLGAPPAPAPRPTSTRAAPAPAPAATATPPTFGLTDLDRRLAAFQARLDATPPLTTTNPETAP